MSSSERDDGGSYDVLVIGSGFGGSVSALRLAEKGYRVAVLEAGRRWTDDDFARQGRRDMLWLPRLGMYGPMRMSMHGRLSLFSAVGVGGGSLIYANTLYQPHDAFFEDPAWAHITDWRAELAPYYDQAGRMLGVTPNPRVWRSDEVLRDVAGDLGAAETFRATDVGVFFDEDRPGGRSADPFFGGVGPDRNGCVHCARCTSGCPFNAKNTLPKNYLYLAEQAGVDVHALTEVVDVRPRPDGRYDVSTRHPGRGRSARRAGTRQFDAEHVVFSAAALGTQKLLHRLRGSGSLPHVSARVGRLARSNSEAIVVALAREPADLQHGVAITSSFHPEAHTHVEICHSNELQDSAAVINVPLTDGGRLRGLRFVLAQLRDPRPFLRSRRTAQASTRTASLLVMQSLDNSLTSYLRRGRLRFRHGTGVPNPSWIPLAHDVARRYADKIGGDAMMLASDLAGRPATAHLIGGATIGDSPSTGVVDPYHRLWGHRNLHVIDGSTIGANLGVNPSLTIVAMAERAVALWPNRGEPDPRPAMGDRYVPVRPVPPRHPVVPSHAPASLRLLPLAPATAPPDVG